MYRSICLVAEDSRQLEALKKYFPRSHEATTLRLRADAQLKQELRAGRFDLVVFHVPCITDDVLDLLRSLQQHAPRPVAVFVDASSDAQVVQAVEAGANAYVVDGLAEARMQHVLDLAQARFKRCHSLREELAETRQRLRERRDIDRAKGILMKSRNLTEDEAYQLLRKLAMDRNQRLGVLALSVIKAAALLQ